jgi:hypothetical protein
MNTDTNTQHTPGPWVAGTSYSGNNIVCAGTALICEARKTRRKAYPSNTSEHNANARLIASAPDLLAALQEVELRLTQARIASNIGRPTLKDADFLRNECERTAAFAREAINKATGN